MADSLALLKSTHEMKKKKKKKERKKEERERGREKDRWRGKRRVNLVCAVLSRGLLLIY